MPSPETILDAATSLAEQARLAADEIVLGSAISQTGKYAREGKFYVDAYGLTVDAVNKAGGVKVGGKPYKLVLKMYDDQSDPNLSVRLFTRLVTSDKVNFLLGPYSSGITIPASASGAPTRSDSPSVRVKRATPPKEYARERCTAARPAFSVSRS